MDKRYWIIYWTSLLILGAIWASIAVVFNMNAIVSMLVGLLLGGLGPTIVALYLTRND